MVFVLCHGVAGIIREGGLSWQLRSAVLCEKEKIEMNEKIVLDDSDVVSIAGSFALSFGLASTFKSIELIDAARNWVVEKLSTSGSYSQWLTRDGIKCQVLSANGNGWEAGRVRLRIEFIPDKPEPVKPVHPISPLDDLRSSLDI